MPSVEVEECLRLNVEIIKISKMKECGNHENRLRIRDGIRLGKIGLGVRLYRFWSQ